MGFLARYRGLFKFDLRFGKSVAIDLLTGLLMFGIVVLLGSMLQAQGATIGYGVDGPELAAKLFEGNPEYNLQFLNNVKAFFFTFVLGIPLALMLILAAGAYSRKLIWEKIYTSEKTQQQGFWRWLGFICVQMLIVLNSLLLYALLLLLVGFVAPSFSYAGLLVQLLYAGAVLLWLYTGYRLFSQGGKIWRSCGEAFVQWRWDIWLVVVVLIFIVSMVLAQFFKGYFVTHNVWITLNIGLVLLYLGWIRHCSVLSRR